MTNIYELVVYEREIFGFDSSLSKNPKNVNNNFIVIGEGHTHHISDKIGEPEKSSVLFLLNQTQSIF